MYDPELPAGCQDADLEMAEWAAIGRREARLKKLGICTHGSRQDRFNGTMECLDCHKVASRDELDAERREALS